MFFRVFTVSRNLGVHESYKLHLRAFIDYWYSTIMLQSYILEGALADVQERTARYLEMLSGGSLGLLLRPTKLTKGSKVSVEAIDKIAVVRLSNGTLENRSLRQLSGGERRRMVSLLEFMNLLVQVNPLYGLWKWGLPLFPV
jgi:hypothetical protein